MEPFSGMTAGTGAMGSWEGRFNGADDTTTTTVVEQPTGATGTFDAHFTNGHVLGAFGARIQDE